MWDTVISTSQRLTHDRPCGHCGHAPHHYLPCDHGCHCPGTLSAAGTDDASAVLA
ncbi:hypothetical protein KUV85_05200 [Nocardioides panacisoli]|uniref:hypothetical protein n=1 Tax=Nocardioides panacisoli TaxID=627624 RepID=UPI001C629A5F|nr:hypothetical protein [Nocardioides panacisoli]QYJ05084.1 hypothetical protein KUV85_05200 [Nocardioides panacisoli]